ncbi:MAG: PAS domain S-box protein [Pseudomonadales bacterium]|nr:PAS domain S-box protein [Pseudomonadales bacterium]
MSDQRNLIFDRLGTREGLSQAVVTAVTQDKNGFIWIGTQEGLNRFDGYSFETFLHQPDNAGSISHHFIRTVMAAEDGTLWVGTDSGLNRFDEASTRFDVFYLNPDFEGGGPGNAVYCLFEDSKHRLWVGTELGLSVKTSASTFKSLSGLVDISAGSIRVVFEDSRGVIWIGSEKGALFKLDEATQIFQPVYVPGQGNNAVSGIVEDDRGQLWVSTSNGKITLIDTRSGEIAALKVADNEALSGSRIYQIFKDKSGDIWVGTNDGLNLWHPEYNRFSRYKHDPTDMQSISDNDVFEIFQDAGGVIWLGTFNGVSKWNAQIGTFPHFKSHADIAGSIDSNSIASFAQSNASNDVWIGTFSGLNKWDAEKGVFEHFTHNAPPLTDNRIMSLAVQDDILWVGTMSGGVNLVKNNRVIKVHMWDEKDPQSISSNAISSIFEDSKGNIWLSTYGGGVNLYIGDGKFKRYPEAGNRLGEFSDLRTLQIIEAHDGKLWIATDGGGVIVLDPETGHTQIYKHNRTNMNSLSSNNVISLLRANNTIWVGTRDHGMNRFDQGRDEFERITKSEGLASDFVYRMLADDAGRLWISGAKGLTVYNPVNAQFTLYNVSHGLQSDDFNSGASLQLSDGSLLFGGNNGFNAFNPSAIQGNTYSPVVKITRFSKFNETVKLPRPIHQSDLIELEYNDFVIGFDFAAMDFTAPLHNQFRYQLKGFDRDWVEAKGSHQVTYTNLDAGEYTFEVLGSNNDSVWSAQATSIKVVVNPPVWATWWAYLVYLLVGLGILFQFQGANRVRLEREAAKRYSERLQLYIGSLEEASDCVLIADANKHLMYANVAINSIFGITPSKAIGCSVFSLIFSDPAAATRAREGLLEAGRWHGEVSSNRGMDFVTTEVTIAAVRDDNDNETAYVSIVRDVTDRKNTESELEKHRLNLQSMIDEKTEALTYEIRENKQVQRELAESLKEKELLLKEVHHRVKNNMQVISSLLNIQAETVGDEIFASLLGESQQRIKSMSLIHENLYQSVDLTAIDFNDYINMLANSLQRFYAVKGSVVRLDIQVDHVLLDIETAVPCGLIINELISNSLKHAFEGVETYGLINVNFNLHENYYVLVISDNGIGLPDGFKLDSLNSMGMEIVSILTQQLDGKLKYISDHGTRFEISFPRKEKISTR